MRVASTIELSEAGEAAQAGAVESARSASGAAREHRAAGGRRVGQSGDRRSAGSGPDSSEALARALCVWGIAGD